MTAANGKRTKTKQLTVEVPDVLHDRLSGEADARGVSLRWLVARLLAESVGRLNPPETFTLTQPDYAMPAAEVQTALGLGPAPEVVPDDGE